MEEKKNTFKEDLMRNFKQLKESRAESVAEEVEIMYRRKIEDLCHLIRNYDRDRENIILDLSPVNALSGAVVPSDFSAEGFMMKDLEIGRNKRDALINLQIMVQRYTELFGDLADGGVAKKTLENNKLEG
jgi:hypothetical protein